MVKLHLGTKKSALLLTFKTKVSKARTVVLLVKVATLSQLM